MLEQKVYLPCVQIVPSRNVTAWKNMGEVYIDTHQRTNGILNAQLISGLTNDIGAKSAKANPVLYQSFKGLN